LISYGLMIGVVRSERFCVSPFFWQTSLMTRWILHVSGGTQMSCANGFLVMQVGAWTSALSLPACAKRLPIFATLRARHPTFGAANRSLDDVMCCCVWHLQLLLDPSGRRR